MLCQKKFYKNGEVFQRMLLQTEKPFSDKTKGEENGAYFSFAAFHTDFPFFAKPFIKLDG